LLSRAEAVFKNSELAGARWRIGDWAMAVLACRAMADARLRGGVTGTYTGTERLGFQTIQSWNSSRADSTRDRLRCARRVYADKAAALRCFRTLAPRAAKWSGLILCRAGGGGVWFGTGLPPNPEPNRVRSRDPVRRIRGNDNRSMGNGAEDRRPTSDLPHSGTCGSPGNGPRLLVLRARNRARTANHRQRERTKLDGAADQFWGAGARLF